MAKDYLCKECPNNNNGWCTAKKMQGLKSVTSCEIKENMIPKNIDDDENNINEFEYRCIGKREMLWTIQSQLLAIKRLNISDENKWNELLKVINSIAIMQTNSENATGTTELFKNSLIDSSMREDSIVLQQLLQK